MHTGDRAELACPQKPQPVFTEGLPVPATVVTATAGSVLGASPFAGELNQPVTAAINIPGSRMLCQVADCQIDLRQTKPYCMKKRLCPEHLTAQAVQRRGTHQGWWRFCQQCGKLEPLEAFDGSKRSCRARLQKRRAHNTAKTHDAQSHSQRLPNQQQRSVGGDQKRHKADSSHKMQRSYDAHEDATEGEDEYLDDDAYFTGAGSGAYGNEIVDTEACNGLAGRAAAAALCAGLDPAAAAAAVAGYGGLEALAAALSDVQQPPTQQTALLQSILLASSLTGAGGGGGRSAMTLNTAGQLMEVQDGSTAQQPNEAARAASLPATSSWPSSDMHSWGPANNQPDEAYLDPATSAALPAAVHPATSALAAVCAVLAGQQQQQQVPSEFEHMQQCHSSGLQLQHSLNGSRVDLQQEQQQRQQLSLPMEGSTQGLDTLLAAAASLPMDDDLQQQQQEKPQHVHVQIKQEASAHTGALAGAAVAMDNGSKPTGSNSHTQPHFCVSITEQQRQEDTAAAAAAVRTGVMSHSGDSAETAAALQDAAAAAVGVGSASDDDVQQATVVNTPSSESPVLPQPVEAKPAAALALDTTCEQASVARLAAAAVLNPEAAAAPAAASALASGSSLAELSNLLQLGASLCTRLNSPNAAAEAAGSLAQDVGTQLLTTIFTQAPAAAATLMLAQQQQLQQLQAQQQLLMNMVLEQREMLRQHTGNKQQQQHVASCQQQQQSKVAIAAASTDPFDALLAAAAAAADVERQQPPQQQLCSTLAAAPARQQKAGANANCAPVDATPQHGVIEAVSAQLMGMAQQLASAFSPAQGCSVKQPHQLNIADLQHQLLNSMTQSCKQA